MDIGKAFDDFEDAVSADPDAVKTARDRRDSFLKAFKKEDDVLDAFVIGSLARSTQIEPINDVDLVVVFDPAGHADWGQAGDSAKEALEEAQKRTKALLGTAEGTAEKLVRRADVRDHAVKCFIDDPEDPDAFTVDLVPALPGEGQAIRIPEVHSQDWVDTDPRHLIDLVEERHDPWDHFRPLVRCLKRWNRDHKKGDKKDMSSLLIERLALDYLPNETRPKAVLRFFTSAAAVIYDRIEDPAGLSGEINANRDKQRAAEALEEARDLAEKAVAAQDRDDTDEAACLWREVFGDEFPEPPDGCGKSAADKLFNVGVGAGAGTQRPIKDAPQG